MAPARLEATMNCENGLSLTADFINEDLSQSLDSTNAFEGPEKLLEIWFAAGSDQLPEHWPPNGLRDIPLQGIESLLARANCSILSKICNESIDAYLLSESSLFVYPHMLVLKTCGRTATLLCLEALNQLLANWSSSLQNVFRVFYSRRSFNFPEKQPELHQSWKSEVQWLNQYFPEGHACEIGDLAKDHWHLYINGQLAANSDAPDETLEVMMTDLDEHACKQFCHEQASADPHKLGHQWLQSHKFDHLARAEALKHDAFAFMPCGFSSNSIGSAGEYYALHITPENGWSYASYETTFHTGLSHAIQSVLCDLRPRRFFFSYIVVHGDCNVWSEVYNFDPSHYVRRDRIVQDLAFGYKMVYSSFERI